MQVDVEKELDRAGAVMLDQHFVYTSGKHGPGYINLDMLFPNVALVSALCDGLIEPFAGQVDTVAAPATGAIILAALSAHALINRGHPTNAVWADKMADGTFVFERAGFTNQLSGKRVLVVEDLLTTGGSVERVCRLAEAHGATVIGASVVCNRGGLTAEKLGIPRLEALCSVSFEAFPADECKLCNSNVPIVEDIGHGDKFKAENPEYKGGFIKLVSS